MKVSQRVVVFAFLSWLMAEGEAGDTHTSQGVLL